MIEERAKVRVDSRRLLIILDVRKVSYFLNRLIALGVLLGLCAACSPVTRGEDTVSVAGCYQVTFLGSSPNGERVSTWRYRVDEQSCAQDLSNWILQLPACAIVVEASPSPWQIVRPDPNYQLNGIKWQTGTDFTSSEFSVVLSGQLRTGTVKVGVQGPDVAIEEITGPACDLATATAISTGILDTSTPTAQLTVTAESSETPTALTPTTMTPSPEPPPASIGTILITDNGQVLTFTCNGNAVEIRGNTNVVTLLGSCGSIIIRGNGNQVYWQSGSPVITNTGNDNIISQR